MTYIQMLDKVFGFGKDVPYEAKIEIYNIVIAYLVQTGRLDSVNGIEDLERVFENLKNDIQFSTYIKTNGNEKVKKDLSFEKAISIIKEWVKEPEDLEYDPSFLESFSHKGKEQIKKEEEQARMDAYDKKIENIPIMMNEDGTVDVSSFSLSRDKKVYSDSNGKRKFKLTKKQILAGALVAVMILSGIGITVHHFNNSNSTEIVTESKAEKMSFRYLIKKGDTIWDLKNRFHTDIIHDKDGNPIKNDSFISEGNTLMITVSSDYFHIYELVKEAEDAYKDGKTFTGEEDFVNMELEESTVKSK